VLSTGETSIFDLFGKGVCLGGGVSHTILELHAACEPQVGNVCCRQEENNSPVDEIVFFSMDTGL
jgi:hypothetical protein